MDGAQARLYFDVYRALVGAAFIQSRGKERSYEVGRAWSYYARPLVDELWAEDGNPIAEQTAHELLGWLQWLKNLENPEGYFRGLVAAKGFD